MARWKHRPAGLTAFRLTACLLRQAMKIPEGLRLYRGMAGGLALPQGFAQADRRGRRGFLEFGFLSATTSRQIAAHFSGAAAGRARATVLEIQLDAVNCGACVATYSQYPGACGGELLGTHSGALSSHPSLPSFFRPHSALPVVTFPQPSC